MAHRAAGQRRQHGGGDGDARRRPILGYRALREVDVDILILIEVLGDAQLCRTAAQAGVRRLHGFLHDRTQIAGQLQLAGAVHDPGLHLQQLTAHLCPRKAVDHADLILLAAGIVLIVRHAQQLPQVFWCNIYALYIRFHQTHSGFPA